MADAPREVFVTARDGARLFAQDWGDPLSERLPLFCLAGLTRNSRDFVRTARRLAPSRRVVAVDLRGRGRSDRTPWRSYDPAIYLDDLRHLLATLGIHRAIVVGTSMGGLLGMAMAVAFPTMLAGLIINDVGPAVTTTGAERIMGYIGRDHPQTDWQAAVMHLRGMFQRLSLQTDEEWLDFAHGTFHTGSDGVLHIDWDPGLARNIVAPPEPVPDLWRLWHAVRRVPTLAIRGGVSDILSVETFARMKTEKPDLMQMTLPDIGHAPSLNEPPVQAAIDDFLESF